MRSLTVLVLFDTPSQTYSEKITRDYLSYPDWSDERDVINTLRKLGHRVVPYAVCDDLSDLLKSIQQIKPDLVFFLCETFARRRDLESQLAGCLELVGIPYTGASSTMLQICKNKALVKQILMHANIRVPNFFLIKQTMQSVEINCSLPYPVIVKPVSRDASEGISYSSVVKNINELRERTEFLQRKFFCDVICESFIDGREFYVGLLGAEKLTCFQPVELIFQPKKPKILTFKAKWDDAYRKKNGIKTCKAKLSEFEHRRLKKESIRAYRALGLNGYARIDWRQNDKGEFYCLEVNPNPAIAKKDDFAKGAGYSGMSYEELIQEIIRQTLLNHATTLRKTKG